MHSLPFFNYRFIIHWPFFFLTLLIFLFLVKLGFWQVERAREKEQMLMAHHHFAKQSPILWHHGVALKPYQSVRLKGRYRPELILLDNQYDHHRFGYHVITPLELMNGNWVLIDRGWVAGDMTRRQLPQITTPGDVREIRGSAYYPSKKNWLLGEAIEKIKGKTTVIERVDMKLISQFLHKSIYPFMIRLDKSEKEGFGRDWVVVSMQPERHYAYALQWFVMAFIVLIVFFSLNLKKND